MHSELTHALRAKLEIKLGVDNNLHPVEDFRFAVKEVLRIILDFKESRFCASRDKSDIRVACTSYRALLTESCNG